MSEYFKNFKKNFIMSGRDDSDEKSNKSRVSATVPMDINLKRRIFIMTITSLLLLKVCFINYWFCSSFTFRLPVVDVINILKSPDLLPTTSFSSSTNTTFEFSNTLLKDLLQEIYLRNEAEYLTFLSHTSLVVEPTLQVSPTQVVLNLHEGFYNYWPGSLQFPTLSFSNVITSKFHDKVGLLNIISPLKPSGDDEVQLFVRQYVFSMFYLSDVSETEYSLDSFQYSFYLLKVGNFSILSTSILFILTLIPLFFIENEFILPNCIVSSIFSGCGAFFSLFNFVSSIIIMARTPKPTSWYLIVLYFLESLLFFLLMLIVWNEFINLKQAKLPEATFSGTKQTLVSETSIPLSSVYSNPQVASVLPTSPHISEKSADNVDDIVQSAQFRSSLKSPETRQTEEDGLTLNLPFPKTDTEESSPLTHAGMTALGSSTTDAFQDEQLERFPTLGEDVQTPVSQNNKLEGGIFSSHLYSHNL
ncbi:hypothetical protein DFJ63DRAFT_332486 [Scheffersomyces coipomensis]|uniref:uncharacterized protein n=1 Tax=Scheffersomyces coipomensis TaxID=1788519 RepID=UPI00315D20B7